MYIANGHFVSKNNTNYYHNNDDKLLPHTHDEDNAYTVTMKMTFLECCKKL